MSLLAFVIDDRHRFLLLKPQGEAGWQVPSGGMEEGETVVEGLKRELREELGRDVKVEPVCSLDAFTYRLDERIETMISIVYLFKYRGGTIIPSDDMNGAKWDWFAVSDLRNRIEVAIPHERLDLFAHAIAWMEHAGCEPETSPTTGVGDRET